MQVLSGYLRDSGSETAELIASREIVNVLLNFVSTIPPATYNVLKTITPVTLPAVNNGVGRVAYSMPVVPLGMTFNPSNRQLRGKPQVERAATLYPLIATDTDGNIGVEYARITIDPPPIDRKSYLHQTLFFKDCVNYMIDSNRVTRHGTSDVVLDINDNDFQTFSTHTDFDINMRVGGVATTIDAVFVKLKGENIRYSVIPTGGSGSGFMNREIPKDLTNWEGSIVSTVFDGFQHDLHFLDDSVTATSVQVTFSGNNIEVYEVMLLELGVTLHANASFFEILHGKIDPTGVIHPSTGGGQFRDEPIGSERWKWKSRYECYFKDRDSQQILMPWREFLAWLEKNKNFIFAPEPSRYPEGVYPALIEDLEFSVRYISEVKPAGDVMGFTINER